MTDATHDHAARWRVVWVAEAVSSTLFYAVPFGLAALLGLGMGMSSRPRKGIAETVPVAGDA